MMSTSASDGLGPGALKAAQDAFARHDYAMAVAIFRRQAESGDAEAQAWLGACFANGYGLPPSLTEAFSWYQRSATQGHVQAATNVGAMLAMGHRVPRNVASGAQWLQTASEAGDTMASYNLATIYSKGDGVPQDAKRAADLYRSAAEAGHYPSQARLGHIYAHGLGVDKDRVIAFAWLSLAAQHGVGSALKALEELVEEMSSDERRSGHSLATRMRAKLAPASIAINPSPA